MSNAAPPPRFPLVPLRFAVPVVPDTLTLADAVEPESDVLLGLPVLPLTLGALLPVVPLAVPVPVLDAAVAFCVVYVY